MHTGTLTGQQPLRLNDIPEYVDAYNTWRTAQDEHDAARRDLAALVARQRTERRGDRSARLAEEHRREREEAQARVRSAARAAEQAEQAWRRAGQRAARLIGDSYATRYAAATRRATTAPESSSPPLTR